MNAILNYPSKLLTQGSCKVIHTGLEKKLKINTAQADISFAIFAENYANLSFDSTDKSLTILKFRQM